MTINSATITNDGKIKLPESIKQRLGLQPGDTLYFHEYHGQIVITTLPTADDWAELIKDIPTERVTLDQNGHYDAKQSPNFDEWMHEQE